MKFAHIADCHIGGWRDPKMRELGTEAFSRAVDKCIKEQVDFVLIAGDLFNTSLPSIERLKTVVAKLKELKDNGVNVYMVAGSHDFSPSGKTILDVIENAGLMTNVVRGEVVDGRLKLNFTVDEKTGTKITGMLGKKGMLEKKFYENLIKDDLESEPGYKIFMFHSALTEFKPKELEKMDSSPLSLLPKNFNYYAGGHVHYIFQKQEPEYGLITFPGALFPNNFAELEKYGHGGFYIVEENTAEWIPIKLFEHVKVELECEHLIPADIELKLRQQFEGKDVNNAIITIRLKGTLESGRTTDIDFNSLFSELYGKNAYFVMKNTSGLKVKEFEEIKIETKDVEELENELIKEHLNQIKVSELSLEQEQELTEKMMKHLNTEKKEGERVVDFEDRLKKEIDNVLGF